MCTVVKYNLIKFILTKTSSSVVPLNHVRIFFQQTYAEHFASFFSCGLI